jgi:hypothetical protein
MTPHGEPGNAEPINKLVKPMRVIEQRVPFIEPI